MLLTVFALISAVAVSRGSATESPCTAHISSEDAALWDVCMNAGDNCWGNHSLPCWKQSCDCMDRATQDKYDQYVKSGQRCLDVASRCASGASYECQRRCWRDWNKCECVNTHHRPGAAAGFDFTEGGATGSSPNTSGTTAPTSSATGATATTASTARDCRLSAMWDGAFDLKLVMTIVSVSVCVAALLCAMQYALQAVRRFVLRSWLRLQAQGPVSGYHRMAPTFEPTLCGLKSQPPAPGIEISV